MAAPSEAEPASSRRPTCQALSGICRHTPGDARQPTALDPAHPAEQGPGQRPGARRRARGLGAHHLSRHRPPQRRRRAGLGRPGPPGRLPAQGGLAHPAHRPDRGRGAGPVHGRPARAGEGPRAAGRGRVGASQADRRAAGRLAARCRARRVALPSRSGRLVSRRLAARPPEGRRRRGLERAEAAHALRELDGGQRARGRSRSGWC